MKLLTLNHLIPLSFILGLSGCLVTPTARAPGVTQVAIDQERQLQYQLLLESHIDQLNRVETIGHAVLLAGRDLCKKTYKIAGIRIVAQQALDSEFHAAANALWGLASLPKIVGISPNIGAEKAGLRIGDTIIRAGNNPIEGTKQSYKVLESYLGKSRSLYELEVLRLGKRYRVSWQPPEICAYPIRFEQNDTINAYADGKNIVILSGMADFAQKDGELALVIAHELAHNIRSNVDAKITNATSGLILGTVLDAVLKTGSNFGKLGQQAGGSAYSVDFETEADYVGMYILARTSYQMDDAAKFWRRMAVKGGKGTIDFASTHPTSVDRMLSLQATANEIRQKQQQGKPLIPNELPNRN